MSQSGSAEARSKALHGTGALANGQGDYPAARSLWEEGLALFRDLGDRRGIDGLLEESAVH